MGPQRRMHRPTAVVASLLLVAIALAACDAVPPPPAASPMPEPGASGASPSPAAVETLPPSPAPTLASLATPTPRPTPLTYTVAAGDTLEAIARRFATTVAGIGYWNRDRYSTLDPDSSAYAPSRIEAGWTLAITPGTTVGPDDVPPAAVRPTPLPSIAVGTAPTPAGDGSSLLISHGARESNVVALTFDMGGRTEPALAIVDWLIDHGIPASVFPTGASATDEAVGAAVMARLAAHPDLFTIGNHSWDHPDITDLDAAAIADQLGRTEAAILEATGRTTVPWFRPPFGTHDAQARAAVGAAGWPFTVMWDVDTIDWKPTSDGGPTADDIVARVLSRAQGGSIVLMHLGGYHTLEALPRIVDGLAGKGLVPVTLEVMLGG